MKRKLLPLIALVSVIILYGCPNKPAEETPVLTPTQTSFTIGAEGGEITINFSTNQTYTVKPSESWITVTTKTKSVESKSVVVKAAPNTSVEPRKANVVIDGGKVNATIEITQNGVEPRIDIATTSYPVGADGGTINVDVDSNVEYEVKVNADWIQSKGKNMGIEVFEVSANGSESERSATVTFSYGSISKNIAISQNGRQKEEEPYINIGTASYSVPAAGGSVNVAVSSNVDYSTAISADWVSGSGNNYTVAENTSESERTATITYSYGNISKEVTIKQAAAEVNPVEEDVLENGGEATFTVPAAGEIIEVTVRTNVDYKVSALPDWIAQTKATGVHEDKLRFVVAPNEGAARSAEISFTYEELIFTVKVSQNAYVPPVEDPVLEVSPKDVSVEAAGGQVVLSVNANYGYEVQYEADWISIDKGENSCTVTVSANTSPRARTEMLTFNNLEYGLMEFVNLVQAGAVSEDDPFDVGSNLSAHGTANSYVVTKAGEYSFDASQMGNGPEGYLWEESYSSTALLWPVSAEATVFKASVNRYDYPQGERPFKALEIWDDNNVITDVVLDYNKMTISFKATGNKGNALIGLYGKSASEATVADHSAPAMWSWHIWCTDSPKHFTQYDLADREYVLLDRNIGATSANPADGAATYGYFYQFGRKDPFKAYPGIMSTFQAATDVMITAVNHPDVFYHGNGTKTWEWYNTGQGLARFTANLWGNPRHLFATYSDPVRIDHHPGVASFEELKKTIYDPCPPGYMVPPEDTWNAVDKESITVLDNGVLIPTASGDSFYPFAGTISGGWNDSGNEAAFKSQAGWYGYAGYDGWQTRFGRDIFREASVYTSCTGFYTLSGEFMGETHMTVWFNHSIEDGMNFDAASEVNVRTYGRPIRCMRVPQKD